MLQSQSPISHVRATFLVYWKDASPSLEVFYFPAHVAHHLSHLGGVTHIESFIQTEMEANYNTNRIIQVLLAGVLPLVMNISDLQDCDWHLINHPLETVVPADDEDSE